jgi:hypothetical protein
LLPIHGLADREDSSASDGVRSPAMKKLIILAIIVALGVVAAKRLRPS